MAVIDWVIVGVFLVSMLAIGALLTGKGSGSMTDFFVSGRKLPWWLAGTSILATSFACDTPLHVTKVIREHGMSGAWFYWTALLFAPMIPFLFAGLWRRAGVVTDCEFIEFRYSGKVAAALRLFMALFRTFAMEAITLGWVILGMVKIIRPLMELPPEVTLLGIGVSSDALMVVALIGVAVLYTAMSGLWGVVTTDFVEFIIAMFGSIFLAVVSVKAVGGIDSLKDALVGHEGTGGRAIEFMPAFEHGKGGLGIGSFIVYLLVLGWAHAESDGGGCKAQRFLACKNERHALLSGIWTITVQNIIRNWPWYFTALASLILFPTLADNEMAYPKMIATLMPAGLRGLMVAAFFAAFLSTVDTHLNLSASYAINDMYRRFVVKNATERHYIALSRLAVVAMAVLAGVIALQMGSILEALKLKGELMSGLGLVMLLRWYWPRVTAWSEIAAMVSSVGTCLVVRGTSLGIAPTAALLGIDPATDDLFPVRLLLIVAVSAVVTIVVTLIVKPGDPVKLAEFYERVRPPGVSVKTATGETVREPLRPALVNWALASVFVASAMFCAGKLILGFPAEGMGLLVVALASGAWLGIRVARGGKSPHLGGLPSPGP
jgi:Na+/proline symporter